MKSVKLISSALLLSTFCLLTATCKHDPELDISPETSLLTIPAEGGEESIIVTSKHTSWAPSITNVTPAGTWISYKIDDNNKDIIKLTIQENETIKERKATLHIDCKADKGLSRIIEITQERAECVLNVDMDNYQISAEGESKTFKITSNTEWYFSDIPSWITLSSTSGSGNKSITMTVRQNTNMDDRKASLLLTTENGEKSIHIQVNQDGNIGKNLEVKPASIVALADGFAFDYQFGSEVMYYYVSGYYPEYLERMTDEEIIKEMSSDPSNRDTPSDGYVSSWSGLSYSTQYVVCTVGYNRSGKHGKLYKTNITTKSGVNQALATISDVGYNETYWSWTTSVNGFVTKYYQWFVTNSYLHNTSEPAIAWFMKDQMTQSPNDFPPIAQGDSWVRPRNGGTVFDVVTWAIDVDGQFSGIIDRFVGQINSSAHHVEKKKHNLPNNPLRVRHKTFKRQ